MQTRKKNTVSQAETMNEAQKKPHTHRQTFTH